jgi:hypothetical protein
VLAVFLLANDMVSLAHTWGARYVLTDFYGWLRTVTDLSAAPAADTISVDKRTGGGTVESGGLTVCVYACVCTAAGGGVRICVAAGYFLLSQLQYLIF